MVLERCAGVVCSPLLISSVPASDRRSATHYYAVLEYCSRGEFFAFVSHPNFTRDHARHFFIQLMQGVEFMHSRSVAHRDLSLENILLDEHHTLKVRAPHTQSRTPAAEIAAPLGFGGVSAHRFGSALWVFALSPLCLALAAACVQICDFGVACETRPNEMIKEEQGPVGKLKYMVSAGGGAQILMQGAAVL